jgi:ATP-binding cassette, subfamily C (CFTR/MRP), member 1
MRWPLLITVFPRLCLIGFNYSQPFLFSTAVTYVSQSDASQNYGYGLIGATILIYLGMAV